jgi:tetratricopeptide (TPR) repeat protein
LQSFLVLLLNIKDKDMKNKFSLFGITCAVALFGACSNPEKMKDLGDQMQPRCEPSRLTAVAGKVRATISVTFPPKFFEPSAVLEITPVLMYDGTERALETKVLQGEKVKDNNTVIRESGGSYTQDIAFDYTENMSLATLELRPTLVVKEKRIPFPKNFRVADGIVANYTLAEPTWKEMGLSLSDDYQKAAEVVKNAEIKFLVNKTDVRSSELKREDLLALQKFLLDTIAQGKNARLKQFYISSYASPDGPLDNNEKLSVGRGKAANTSINTILKNAQKPAKKSKTPPPPAYALPEDLLKMEHTAEDWDGFKQLMEQSSITDKHLVLRVLSMYSDPQVRETEIKNISKVYKEIADKVLPELRRSKIVLTAETFEMSDEELKQRIENNQLDNLNVEQLLYAARVFYSNDAETQKAVYQYAADKYDDYRVLNNLGAKYLAEGNLQEAKRVLEGALAAYPNAPEVNNNLGYVALAQGDYAGAEKYLLAAGVDASKVGLGHLAIRKGQYENAATLLSDVRSVDAGLAFLLTGKLTRVPDALKGVDKPAAYYILAIVAARDNNEAGVKDNIAKAASQDATWREKAKKDIEFANFAPQL